MINYNLSICYGIIVSVDVMEEIKEVLTDEEYDEVMEVYFRCVNTWIGDEYFIGIITELSESESDCVYHISDFTIPSDYDKDLIRFKQFFDEHDLWSFIDWKPELLLINFCY